MKKMLLATTALVATAGVASAEVTLSGFAEIGIIGGSNFETQFHHDFDVRFTLSGETDNGLTFGATVDLDEISGGIGNTRGPHAVFISGDFGTVTLGDTDGAFDWAMQEVGIGSALADDHTTHVGFDFNSGTDGFYDGQILRYNNTFGDFGVAVSVEIDDNGVFDPAWGIGFRYQTSLGGVDLTIGLAHQFAEPIDASVTGLSVDAQFANGFRAILNYADYESVIPAGTHTGLGVGYTSGDLTLSANWGEYNADLGPDASGWGVAANYALGGGAVAQFGYGSSDPFGGPSFDTWSLGLALSF